MLDVTHVISNLPKGYNTIVAVPNVDMHQPESYISSDPRFLKRINSYISPFSEIFHQKETAITLTLHQLKSKPHPH